MSRKRILILKAILVLFSFTMAIPVNASTLDGKKNELSQIQNQIKDLNRSPRN